MTSTGIKNDRQPIISTVQKLLFSLVGYNLFNDENKNYFSRIERGCRDPIIGSASVESSHIAEKKPQRLMDGI